MQYETTTKNQANAQDFTDKTKACAVNVQTESWGTAGPRDSSAEHRVRLRWGGLGEHPLGMLCTTGRSCDRMLCQPSLDPEVWPRTYFRNVCFTPIV